MTAATIRPAADAELEDVLRLRLCFIADIRGIDPGELATEFVDATRAYLADVIDRRRIRSWFAELDGELVGLSSVLIADVPPLPEEHRALEGYLVNVWVAPQARKRGIARQLLEAALDAAPAEGWRRIYLHATDDGRPLYEQAGFASDSRWMGLRLPVR